MALYYTKAGRRVARARVRGRARHLASESWEKCSKVITFWLSLNLCFLARICFSQDISDYCNHGMLNWHFKLGRPMMSVGEGGE